jgi:hypothetical protein
MNKIVLFILFILILILIQKRNEINGNTFVDSSKICILLTTCVNPSYTQNKLDKRKEIYTDVINKYLTFTNFDIYVVESSGYTFPEFENNPRVKVYSYKNYLKYSKYLLLLNNPSPLEATSIINAISHFNLNEYQYVIKITGRYFIPNINEILNTIPIGADLILQNNQHIFYQHTEIFGCKTKYFKNIMEFIKNYNLVINFEIAVFLYSIKYKYYRLPKIKLDECIIKGSTNRFLCTL